MYEEEEMLLEGPKMARRRHFDRENGWLAPFILYRWLAVYFVLLHILLALLIVGDISSFFRGTWNGQPFIIFPELRQLDHKVTKYHATNHSAYTQYSGPPNAANAAAWEHLLQPLYFNASKRELLVAGDDPSTAIRVKNGGYIAALGIYHEIHCLEQDAYFHSPLAPSPTLNVRRVILKVSQNKLRSFLWSPQGSADLEPNATLPGIQVSRDHLDHCLEVLRMNAMCNPDLSLFTFSWPEDPTAMFLDAHSESSRRCVDWRQIEHYAEGRMIGLEPTLLRDVPDQ